MSKNIRSRERVSANDSNHQASKRQKCDRTVLEPSESVLWPETEDSFFTDVKLDKILAPPGGGGGGGGAAAAAGKKQRHSFYENNSDDSLFSDIVLPNESENVHSNVGATPITPIVPTSDNGILGDDTLFSEIDLDQFVSKESSAKEEGANKTPTQVSTSSQQQEVDLFKDDDFPIDELLVQDTQKFLADVAFKVPRPPAGAGSKATQATNKVKTNIDCCIQGTQYETREEIQNRTMIMDSSLNQTNVLKKESENLTRFNWETEVFDDELVEDYPCKGDFYGLPDRVKDMIMETKGIKSLYGK